MSISQPFPAANGPWVDLVFLGGLGEIGLNMMVFESSEDLIIIDAGIMFPEDYMLGIDIVIPDFSYIRERRQKAAALILTHGHEDHIGAVPFLLKEISLPVYGTALTLELVKEKLKEHRMLDQADLRLIQPRHPLPLGPFEFDFIRVSHSIVDGVGLAVNTPVGTFIHSGDFKIDSTPMTSEITDLNRFAEYGEKGVLALLSDSTNAERPGYTMSERDIGETLEGLFREARGRIIIAVFASHIPRLQQIVHLAAKFNRKLLFNGKSMAINVRIAKELGFLKIPPEQEITVSQLKHLPDKEVVIVTTGSQGEPMSALARIALDSHKHIHIKAGDLVILSSKFIPGNEKAISTVINNLYRLGAEVVYEEVADIHVSGHASQEELKLLINLTKPQYFIPIHGELRHLIKHTQVAKSLGIAKERLLLARNGDRLRFDATGGRVLDQVDVGRVFVDGKGVGDVSQIVLRDRRHLAEDGLVIAVVAVDAREGKIVSGPDLVSRGFVFEEEQTPMLTTAREIIKEIVSRALLEPTQDWLEIQIQIGKALRKYFFKLLERRPMILPLVLTL
ncbi:MAG: ribonuclease J [Deltaproteobacteria bacterium]|nr:ribonuclease J [Deltaproteobacteria bacterium]MBW1951936.1 ribonuclease J [Deltaproteobacteria bacterium]MBW1986317.1 ribonuclease J [Deltaproteobacteria bacterium]MBW2134358.1 ribonuclease J [Deltaproteobacteria bacterium]